MQGSETACPRFPRSRATAGPPTPGSWLALIGVHDSNSFSIVLDFRQPLDRRSGLPRVSRRSLLSVILVVGLGVILIQQADAVIRLLRWTGGAGKEGDSPPIDTSRPLVSSAERVPGGFTSPAERKSGPTDSQRRLFPGVSREALQAIRDDTPFSNAEQGAWLNLFRIVGEKEEADLRRASSGRVTFAQLFRQPEEYRGELVTVRGTMFQAEYVRRPKAEQGISGYWQTWLVLEDAPRYPVVVYCLALPDGLPTGRKVNEEVEATGFFFKRWSYPAQDRERYAPVLIARGLDWHPAPAMAPQASPPVWAAVLGAVVMLGAVAGYLLLYARRERGPSLSDGRPFQVGGAASPPTEDEVRQSLAELADRQRTNGDEVPKDGNHASTGQ